MHPKLTYPDIVSRKKWLELEENEAGGLWGDVFQFYTMGLGICAETIGNLHILDGYLEYYNSLRKSDEASKD